MGVANARGNAVGDAPGAARHEEIVQEVLSTLEVHLRDYLAQASASQLPSAADLTRHIATTLPQHHDLHPIYARLGSFYDTEGARRHLGGMSKQAVAKRRAAGMVLAMQTSDGRWLYPTWQFSPAGGVRQQLAPVLREFAGVDGWTAATWLMNPHPALGGDTPREFLADEGSPQRVVELARHDAAALVAA